jgi:hypothetical protein
MIQFLMGSLGIIGEEKNCAHLRGEKYLDQVFNEYSWGRKNFAHLRRNMIFFGNQIKF